MDKNKIIILTGPTGVGKTKHSISLAKEINGEIISCDSFQIYKYMDIGTAKVTKEEAGGVIHHNIDIVNPDEDFNVALFKKRTESLIKDIHSRGKVPILTGGTGLYLHSLIYDLDFTGGSKDSEIREKIEKEINDFGLQSVYTKLINIDKNLSNYLEINNRHRIIRAYEMYLVTGKNPIEHLDEFRSRKSKYDFLYLIINDNREMLYENINIRVDQMIKEGLLAEITNLLEKGYDFNLRSFKAIGYKEFKDYFKGLISLDDVIDKIKQHSRNYAKRQITWFKRVDEGIWLNKNEYSSEEEFYNVLLKKTKEFLLDERSFCLMNEINDFLINRYDVTKEQIEFVENSMKEISYRFLELDKIREYNQYKVLSAFNDNRLSATDFYWTTGYGYGDIGRDKVEAIYSTIFNTEDSLVRPTIASGTHAINLVLSGLLKHGDEMIEISGTPYDTLKDVIGLNRGDNTGSLIDNGILYKEVPLKEGRIDVEAVLKAIGPSTKLLAIQRSTGYSDREAITIEDMEYAISFIKKKHPNIIIFVDNCYGEFTDYKEPSDIGADILAGSLIKNPGGGIAVSGGYITGKKNLIKLVSNRLTSPGLGKEVGLSFGTTRGTLQGLFLAPLVVNQSLKGAVLLGQVYKNLGFKIVPEINSTRSDIIQGIEFNNPEIVKSFCRSIQEASAVDSHVYK